MNLAFTTFACPQWTLEHVVAAAQLYGSEGLALRLLAGQVLHADLPRTTRE